MPLYYRIEKHPEKMLDPEYKSAHHSHSFPAMYYLQSDLQTLPHLGWCDGLFCGSRRVPLKIAQTMMLDPDNLPCEAVSKREFCYELEGLCCLETLDEIMEHICEQRSRI